MNFRVKRIAIMILAVLLALSIFSCKKEEEDEVSSQTTGFADDTVTKMNNISDSFIPSSMSSSSSSSSSLLSQFEGDDGPLYSSSDDPCDGTDLFGCQSRLVKLYLKQSNQMFDATIEMLNFVSRALGEIPDGTSGTHTIDNSQTLHYSKTSAGTWDLLLVNASGTTFLDISANTSTYTMKMDMTNNPDDDDDIGQFEITATYTDDTHWEVNLFLIGQDCSTEDVRAPKLLRTLVERDGSLYTGKTMLYSPRWAIFNPDPTCSSSVTDDSTMNLYTDFVANSTAAKVKVYMMKRSVSDLSSIGTYAMGNLCDSYWNELGTANAATCNAGLALSTTYPNPFCTTGPNQLTWGDDCSTTESNVALADYSPASDWILPSAFYTQTITLRTSL